MDSNSSPIISAQHAPHKDLTTILNKHSVNEYKLIIPDDARRKFDELNQIILANPQPIILDSGCGTGESSYYLTQHYPQYWVIGIDKSQHRLSKSSMHGNQPENLLFVCTNLIYLWQLAFEANWLIQKNYLLYPNPWPKASQLKRRWHGHPIFPTLIKLSKKIELRTNWNVYAEEFSLALQFYLNKKIAVEQLQIEKPMTAFERKYTASAHSLYALTASV